MNYLFNFSEAKGDVFIWQIRVALDQNIGRVEKFLKIEHLDAKNTIYKLQFASVEFRSCYKFSEHDTDFVLDWQKYFKMNQNY